MSKRQLILWMLLLILASLAVAQAVSRKKTSPKSASMSSEEMRAIAFDFINALSYFYMSTHIDQQPEEDDVQWMTTMMNDNRWLSRGMSLISKYKDHRNEIIRVAAQGAITGAELARDANTDLLAQMRTASKSSPDELKYQLARYLSRQKEAYSLIFVSVPWITGVMFQPKETHEQTGAIPYTISKADRVAIVEEIDRVFGGELAAEKRGERKDRHNAIVLAAQAIRKNLAADSYEEIEQH